MEIIPINTDLDAQKRELEEKLNGSNYSKYAHFLCAAISSIPWIGSLIGASSALHAEIEQGEANVLIGRWLLEHQNKIVELQTTLNSIIEKVESCGTQERLNDESFLSLVRQGFLVWDQANTTSKRDYVRRTLTNAAVSKICADDVVRLFLGWINQYDEIHFRLISILVQNRGATRGRMWEELGDTDSREDSADADLFKLLIHDLSMGHVLRQMRDKNMQGQFLKKSRRINRLGGSDTMESAFEDTKPYELTALGDQFATYVLNEVVPQIGA